MNIRQSFQKTFELLKLEICKLGSSDLSFCDETSEKTTLRYLYFPMLLLSKLHISIEKHIEEKLHTRLCRVSRHYSGQNVKT